MKWNIANSFSAFFPNGEPIIFYRGENPLHTILEECYGNIYFLIAAPNQDESESFFFFRGFPDGLLQCFVHELKSGNFGKQIVAYGSLDCLLSSTEMRHNVWKEMIGKFFQEEKPYQKRDEQISLLAKTDRNARIGIDSLLIKAIDDNGVLVQR